MRVRYSFSARRSGHIENIRKQKESYPDIVKKLIEESDIILEVLDARFIEDTRNKAVEESILEKGKRIIYVINKADLIDKKKIDEAILKELYPYVFLSSKNRRGLRDLRKRINIEAKKLTKLVDTNKKVGIGVIGYPNTGKSTLINTLAGRHAAGTAPEAGFTKGVQKIRLNEDLRLIDSPGVIPEKEYSETEQEKISKHARLGGRSFSQVKDPEMVIVELMKKDRERLEKHYNIKTDGDTEILIEELGKKRGFLKKGGLVDEDKTARFILREWQEGKID